MVVSSPDIPALLLALSLAASSAAGQQAVRQAPSGPPVRASGRIVRLEAGDTLPVGGVPIVLHRVSVRAQGPIDTVRADREGAFGVRFAAESGATFLLSVRWAGIEYFSDPIGPASGNEATAVVIVVADTASDAPVRLRQRTTLITAPDESGSRLVFDWLALANSGTITRVAPDTASPVWAVPLPAGAEDAALAESGLTAFSPDAIGFRNDSVLIWAPISPGTKELLLQYRIPRGRTRLAVPTGGGVDTMHLLVEEPSAKVSAGQLVSAASQDFEGRTFRRWTGPVRAAATIDVSFSTPALEPGQALVLLLGMAGLGFLGLTWLLIRRRRAAPAPAAEGPGALTDAIARLDLRYRGREGEVPDAEWRSYQAERAQLKARLAASLAALRRRS